MEQLLIEFIDTLDRSLKKSQAEIGEEGRGLTVSQLQYVEAVASLPMPTVTDIAEALTLSKASVTAGINKLVRLGYVAKTQSKIDRRMVHIKLTAAGDRLVAAKQNALADYLRFIQDALSPEEVEQFQHLMQKLVAYFQDHE